MPISTAAFLYALASGVILWALGFVAQRQGWIVSRRTETDKLSAARIALLEQDVEDRDALIHQLREAIIEDKMKGVSGIGFHEISEKQRKLLTCTPEQLRVIGLIEKGRGESE